MTKHELIPTPVDTGKMHGPQAQHDISKHEPNEPGMEVENQYDPAKHHLSKERIVAPTEPAVDVDYEQLKKNIADTTKKMQDIINKYGGQLANIPQASEYWTLRNQLQQFTEVKKYADEGKLREIREEADKKKAEIEAKAKQDEAKVDAEAAAESAKVVAAAQVKPVAEAEEKPKHDEHKK